MPAGWFGEEIGGVPIGGGPALVHDGGMDTTTTPQAKAASRFERPRHSRVLGGVAAAIAERAGLSVGLVRLGFIIATLFGGLGVVLYAAGWVLLPSEGEPQSPAQRWADALATPGRRVGAVLIGIGGLIFLGAAAPVTIAAALIILGYVAFTTDRDRREPAPVGELESKE